MRGIYREIRRFPMLSADDEYTLAKDWKSTGNVEAAHKLVTSHLRLVAKIAMGYRGYGLPVSELIAEGNLGMMHAVKKFEPEKDFACRLTQGGGSRRAFRNMFYVHGRWLKLVLRRRKKNYFSIYGASKVRSKPMSRATLSLNR